MIARRYYIVSALTSCWFPVLEKSLWTKSVPRQRLWTDNFGWDLLLFKREIARRKKRVIVKVKHFVLNFKETNFKS